MTKKLCRNDWCVYLCSAHRWGLCSPLWGHTWANKIYNLASDKKTSQVIYWSVFRIRIQTGQTVTPKKAKIKKFHVWRVPCWAGGFFWSLKVLLRVQEDKSFVIKKQGHGYKSEFSTMPVSGSGLSEPGSETLLLIGEGVFSTLLTSHLSPIPINRFKGSDQWKGRGCRRRPNHYMLVGEVVLDVFLSF